jgi:Mycothiol maleylpyruvate isomerase N-terminal domain
MTRDQDLQALQSAFETFTACLSRLAVPVFLRPVTEWAPRDVVAHLIGWNHYTRTGCEQIRQGMLPFYFADAADDFRHVNATSVQTYASPEKHALIEELTASFQALLRFLICLPPEAWEADYGVRYQGGPITIANTVDALSRDYLEHTKDIEKWVTSGNG